MGKSEIFWVSVSSDCNSKPSNLIHKLKNPQIMRRFFSEMRSNIDIKDVGAKTSDIYWAASQRPPAVSCKSEAERLSDTKASPDL